MCFQHVRLYGKDKVVEYLKFLFTSFRVNACACLAMKCGPRAVLLFHQEVRGTANRSRTNQKDL